MRRTEATGAFAIAPVPSSEDREVRVGIVGYGTVGRATAETIVRNADEIRARTGGISLRVVRLCHRSARNGESGAGGAPVDSDWKKITTADDIDIVVEAIGGADAACEVVRSALENGKAVVTANKTLIARHGEELFALADRHNLPIGIEATVGGGIPIVRGIADALAADRIQAVFGIVNGTCNFILTKMAAEGMEFDAALAAAQTAGFAEANPALDIDGLDACDKISILARLAFRGAVDSAQVPVTGIRQVAAVDFHFAGRLDSTIRLVAAAEREADGFVISVKPWLVRRGSMLAKVEGANNAIFLSGEKAGVQMLYGQGAGGEATATAVLSDVVQIARGLGQAKRAPNAHLGFQNHAPLPLHESARPRNWYLRLTFRDRPGILAQTAQAIADEGINIEAVVQGLHVVDNRVSFAIMLEPVRESRAQKAVATLNRFDFMYEPVLILPIDPSTVS